MCLLSQTGVDQIISLMSRARAALLIKISCR